jgi:hypothetical protein
MLKIIPVILIMASSAFAGDLSTTVRHEEIDSGHITVLGVMAGARTMDWVTAKLGHAVPFNRGTKERPVMAVCYASDKDNTKALFVAGPRGVRDKVVEIRLISGDLRFDDALHCASSTRVSKDIATESGLRLGATPAGIKALLGPPTDESPGFLGYEFHVERRLTEAEVGRIEKRWPDVRKYPYHDVSSSVEARFAGKSLKRLDLYRLVTY